MGIIDTMKTNKIAGMFFAGLMGIVGITSLNADGKASHNTIMEVKGYRNILVDENGNIIGIQNLSRGYFPENEIQVYMNGMKTSMTPAIKLQYYNLLNPETASRAGINWNQPGAWYQQINPNAFKGLEKITENYSSEGMKITSTLSGSEKIITITDN
jgi:hypothetical protein